MRAAGHQRRRCNVSRKSAPPRLLRVRLVCHTTERQLFPIQRRRTGRTVPRLLCEPFRQTMRRLHQSHHGRKWVYLAQDLSTCHFRFLTFFSFYHQQAATSMWRTKTWAGTTSVSIAKTANSRSLARVSSTTATIRTFSAPTAWRTTFKQPFSFSLASATPILSVCVSMYIGLVI